MGFRITLLIVFFYFILSYQVPSQKLNKLPPYKLSAVDFGILLFKEYLPKYMFT